MPTIRVAQRPAPHRQDARFGVNRMIPPGEQKIVPARLAAFSRIRPIPQTETLCETISVHPLWVQSYPFRVHSKRGRRLHRNTDGWAGVFSSVGAGTEVATYQKAVAHSASLSSW